MDVAGLNSVLDFFLGYSLQYCYIYIYIYISKCLRQRPHRALERVMSTSGASPNVFLRKIFSFFQIITYLESKFEEAGRTAISAKKSRQLDFL